MDALDRWRHDLEAWAIPEAILAQAEESPWIHPPVLFEVPNVIESTPSHQRAAEVLFDGATLLDVGCGGGIAAMAHAQRLSKVIGVDHQSEMLVMFERNAAQRSLEVETIEGFWPAVAEKTAIADVVTAHHVLYNVADVGPFIKALDSHARSRVVLEVPALHPLASLSGAWRHFWDLERPVGPSAEDLIDVLTELGIDASLERFEGTMRVETDLDQAAHFTRIRLCLPASREDEVLDFVTRHRPPSTRSLATIWWDT